MKTHISALPANQNVHKNLKKGRMKNPNVYKNLKKRTEEESKCSKEPKKKGRRKNQNVQKNLNKRTEEENDHNIKMCQLLQNPFLL